MGWLLTFVGSPRLFIPVASALVVGLILWIMIQFGESNAEKKQLITKQQEYIETRQKIDEKMDGVKSVTPDAALEWLRARQNKN